MKNRCYQFLFNCSSHKKRKRGSRSHSSSSRESDGRKKRHKKRKHHHAKYSDSSDSSSSTSSSTSSSDTSSTESHRRKKKKRKKKRQHHKRKHHKRHQTLTEEDIKPDLELEKYVYFRHLKFTKFVTICLYVFFTGTSLIFYVSVLIIDTYYCSKWCHGMN